MIWDWRYTHEMIPAEMKAIRASLGLTQTEMADVLCVTSISISRFERGALSPSGTVQMVYTELSAGWKPERLKTILKGRNAK